MAKETHPTIELNGKRYNARTGALIDGVKKPAEAVKTAVQDVRRHVAERKVAPSKHVHRALQPSRTLMRSAVKKPSTITSRKTVAMDVVPPKAGANTAVNAFHTPDPSRIKRAHSVHKLSAISRFGQVGTAEAAAKAPVHTKPVVAAAHATAASPAPHQAAHATHISNADKMLQKGMKAAESHTAVKHSAKKTRVHHRVGNKLGLSQRATSFAASGMAILVIGGFFAYQNIPNMSVRYASAKAGVRAGLPGYKPAGFAVNSHVQYNPGMVTISYHANTDDRSYTVTQRNTSWNSQALKDHLVTTSNVPQSYPSKGQTIYMHDGNKADWVAGGVWYSISGDASLSTEQLIQIATSI